MDRHEAPPRTALLAAAVAVGCCVLAAGLLRDDAGETFSDVAQLLAAVAASVTTGRHARRSTVRRTRASWTALSAACACWAAGETVWTWVALEAHEVPFPSVADVGFLAFPCLAAAALLLHPASGGSTGRWQRTLDATMTAGAVGLVSWQTSLGTVVSANRAGGSGGAVLLIVYPALDVVLVVLAVLVLTRARGHRLPLGLVGAGLFALALADSTFAYLEAGTDYDGGLVDLGWVLGFLLIALAGTCARAAGAGETQPVAPVAARVSFLPYVPVCAALAVVGATSLAGESLSPAETVVAALVVVLLLARQFATLRDNVRLTARLADQEALLRHRAFHDPLTGLANRALFLDRLEHALHLHERDLRPVSVLFIDLDDFKAVNDTFGHAAGDELLVRVAERLIGVVRTGDTVARLGGDEFAILLEDGGDPLATGEHVRDALRTPFLVGGGVVSVGGSVGVGALAAHDTPLDADALLAQADAALYAAKRAGKGRLVSYARHLAAGPGTAEPAAAG